MGFGLLGGSDMWGAQKKEKTMDMTEGGIVGKVIAFSLPLLVGNLFQQMYNMVDSIVVGSFQGTGRRWHRGAAGMPIECDARTLSGDQRRGDDSRLTVHRGGDQKTIRDMYGPLIAC